MVYDVIIIGSGIVGLFISYELARRGFSVAVVDKHVEPGWEISRRHAGVLHVIQLPFSSYKSKLARLGNIKYNEICKWLGVECVDIPALLVVDKWWKLPVVIATHFYLLLNGIRSSICMRCGVLKKDFNFVAAVEVSGYKVIDSFGLIYRLYDSLRDVGVNFYLGCRVDKISEDNNGVSVTTTCGNFSGRFAINAAGLYADEIARQMGINIMIKPGKGVMAVFYGLRINAILAPLSIRPHPRTKGGAIIPTVYGTVLLGPNLLEARGKDDFSVDERSVYMLIEKFSKYIKNFNKLIPIKVYAGNRPLSPTGDVIIKTTLRTVHILGTESPVFTGAPALAEDVVKILERLGLERRDPKELPPPRPIQKCGKVICFCRGVTECEIREAVRRGSKTLDGVMARFGIGMGPCQGSKCMAEIIKIIAEELGVEPRQITKFGEGSWLVL